MTSRPWGDLLSAEDAWATILAHVGPLPAITVRLEDAAGAMLADDLCAVRDLPPACRSAMDGYAVRSEDTRCVPCLLEVRGEAAAGSAAAPPLTPGSCVAILTGANLPPGADAVVRFEDTSAAGTGERVTILRGAEPGLQVVARGALARADEHLLAAGMLLDPAGIALCAANGCPTLSVHRRPNVAVVVTGDELVEPGSVAGPHQAYDANGPMIEAAVRAQGCLAQERIRAGDDLDLIAVRLREAAAVADAVIVSGGVSVGRRDFVPAAIERAGARIRVHGVAVKPGKPFLFALAGQGIPVFGLPGNPLGAWTDLHEFVLPALARMAGRRPEACRIALPASLAAPLEAPRDRALYAPGRLAWSDGGVLAMVTAPRNSADMRAACGADGAAIVPAGARLDAGARVAFRPWRRFP